jgi:hypothetical protein
MNTITVGNPNAVIEFLTATQLAQASQFSFQQAYGSFSSSTTQSIAQAPAVSSLTYNTTDLAGGGVILSGSTPTASILIPMGGTYRVITSVQLNRSGGGSGEVYVWFAIDGTPVANTSSKTQLTNSVEVISTIEVLLPLFAGQTVSIQANAVGTGDQALAEVASPPRPAVPSIITIVQRIA